MFLVLQKQTTNWDQKITSMKDVQFLIVNDCGVSFSGLMTFLLMADNA